MWVFKTIGKWVRNVIGGVFEWTMETPKFFWKLWATLVWQWIKDPLSMTPAWNLLRLGGVDTSKIVWAKDPAKVDYYVNSFKKFLNDNSSWAKQMKADPNSQIFKGSRFVADAWSSLAWIWMFGKWMVVGWKAMATQWVKRWLFKKLAPRALDSLVVGDIASEWRGSNKANMPMQEYIDKKYPVN